MRPLSTVLKTLAVLDHLGTCRQPLRLSEVAQALGLSRPTAYQRLLTLVEAGWVEQDDFGRYRVSLHAARIGGAAIEHASLGERVAPLLERLVTTVKETASVAVLDRGLPCIIQRVEAESVLRAVQKIGTLMSLDGSASGRVLVAFADAATRARLEQSEAPLPDEDTLETVRTQGFALSSGRVQPGVLGVAAPIFDLNGKCIAALSLVAPQVRFDLAALKEPLLTTARDVTKLLRGETV